MFVGNVLHGVIPGKSFTTQPGWLQDTIGSMTGNDRIIEKRRITFMVAFWEDISFRKREDGKPGSSQPFPSPHVPPQHYTWPTLFERRKKDDNGNSIEVAGHVHHTDSDSWGESNSSAAEVLPISQVWEDVDTRVNDMCNCSVGTLTNLPCYDVCFQGF